MLGDVFAQNISESQIIIELQWFDLDLSLSPDQVTASEI